MASDDRWDEKGYMRLGLGFEQMIDQIKWNQFISDEIKSDLIGLGENRKDQMTSDDQWNQIK